MWIIGIRHLTFVKFATNILINYLNCIAFLHKVKNFYVLKSKSVRVYVCVSVCVFYLFSFYTFPVWKIIPSLEFEQIFDFISHVIFSENFFYI